MGSILFQDGKTETVSPVFETPATVAGFNMAPTEYPQDENGLTTEVICGDVVTFERVLLDSDYNIDCRNEIDSEGVTASHPLRDECGNDITLTACNNIVDIPHKGNYRAIYNGDGRPTAIVTKD